MEFDVDAGVPNLLPWNLSFVIGGKRYPVRPITIADVGSLLPVVRNQNSHPMADVEVVQNLFEEPKPDLRSIPIHSFMLICGVIVKEIEAYASKNREAIAAVVSVAMAPAGDSRSGGSLST